MYYVYGLCCCTAGSMDGDVFNCFGMDASNNASGFYTGSDVRTIMVLVIEMFAGCLSW